MDKIEPKGEIIWDKGVAPTGTAWGSFCSPADPCLADQHEYILIFRKKGKRQKPETFDKIPDKLFHEYRRSIWRIAPAKARQIGHDAPFPVEIPLRVIILYTFKGETVLDPFMGSGQTAMMAVETKRNYIGIDNNPEYVALAEERIKNRNDQLELF
jgi:site-specific DNA-methyltransferase (adenine-specific)